MPNPNPDLTEKQRKLVQSYLNGCSKKQALADAGYSGHESGHRAFSHPAVKKEIQRRQHIMSTKSGVTADWIIERLKAIADANASDLMVLDEEGMPRTDMTKMTPALRIALESYSTEGQNIKIKNADKLRALEMLARHLGMFNDKLELAGELSLEERLQAGRNRLDGKADD